MVGGREVQGLWGPDLGYMANVYQCSLQLWLGCVGLKEQSCVIGGVVINVYIIVVQGETVRPRSSIVGETMKLTICLDTLRLGLVLHADIVSRHHP